MRTAASKRVLYQLTVFPAIESTLPLVQALDVQTRASFVEHEAKLDQQREALARQHQKGLNTMQAGIDSLQAQLASDAQQHAAVMQELQDRNSALQHQKDQACGRGVLPCMQ